MRLSFCCALGALALAGCVAATASRSPVPHPEASPADTAARPRLDARALERALHRVANRVRTARGRPPLAWSDSLRRLARGHSRDMAQRGFFSHTTPSGATPAVRARRLGLPTTRPLGDGHRIGIGENLFRTRRYAGYRDVYRQRSGGPRRHVRREYDWKSTREVARQTVEGWLDSPAHRRALLSREYQQQGLGVALTDERIYVTQNLF